MNAQDWVLVIGSMVTLVGAIGAAVVAVVKALKDGQAEKAAKNADPEQPGSGAAICEAIQDMADEQREFNTRLALHLGMIPMAPRHEDDDTVSVRAADGNGRR